MLIPVVTAMRVGSERILQIQLQPSRSSDESRWIAIRNLLDARKDAFLFGEAQGRVVVSVKEANKADFEQLLQTKGQSFENLGRVEGQDAIIDGESFGSLNELKNSFDNSIEDSLH